MCRQQTESTNVQENETRLERKKNKIIIFRQENCFDDCYNNADRRTEKIYVKKETETNQQSENLVLLAGKTEEAKINNTDDMN